MKIYFCFFPSLALLCLTLNAGAAGTVTSADESSLRAALTGGGVVTFTVTGTIPLSSTLVISNDTTIDAAGQSIVLSGNNVVRVMQIMPGIQLVLRNLTIANGSTNQGAGLYNDGNATITNCIFSGNHARGTNGVMVINGPSATATPGETVNGGAIFNAGILTLLDCVFATNSARGGTGGTISGPYTGSSGPGGNAFGGAILSSGTSR